MRSATWLVLAVSLAVLSGCQSSDGTATAQADAAAQRSGTSDPGSRYLDLQGPVGGLAVETPPVVGKYIAGAETASKAPTANTTDTTEPAPMGSNPPPAPSWPPR